MWKYRGEIIFGLALVYALKSIIRPDLASVAGLILMLGAHYVDRYFSADRVERKIIARVAAIEEDAKNTKNDIARVSMSLGIRGANSGR